MLANILLAYFIFEIKYLKNEKILQKHLTLYIYIYIYNVHVIDYEIYNLKINIEKG